MITKFNAKNLPTVTTIYKVERKTVWSIAEKENLEFMTLEVRAGNLAAQGLYEKYGWEKVGVRKNFYEKPREDAFLYNYYLTEEGWFYNAYSCI